MTIDIITLESAPGKITFIVFTDENGCDEDFTASIGGTVRVTVTGKGSHPNQSIAHTLTGPRNVVITASASGVSSNPTPLNLSQ